MTAYCLAQQPTKPSKYVYAYSFQTLQVVASGCMGSLSKGLQQMSYIGCGIIILCEDTDVPIKSVSLRLNCADRSYQRSSRDILVSVCYLF